MLSNKCNAAQNNRINHLCIILSGKETLSLLSLHANVYKHKNAVCVCVFVFVATSALSKVTNRIYLFCYIIPNQMIE